MLFADANADDAGGIKLLFRFVDILHLLVGLFGPGSVFNEVIEGCFGFSTGLGVISSHCYIIIVIFVMHTAVVVND